LIDLALSPRTLRAEDCKGKLTVVIDVLRATTTIVTALSAGAREVVPVSSWLRPEEERACFRSGAVFWRRAQRGPAPRLRERELPSSTPPAKWLGAALIFTSTNGTQAILRGLAVRVGSTSSR